MQKKLTACLVLILLAGGCTSVPPPTDFLGGDAALLGGGRFFAREYAAPGTSWTRYSKVQVLPVTLDYFSSSDIQKKTTVEPLAEIMRKEFENALKASRTLVPAGGKADAETLVIEPALVQTSGTYSLVDVQSVSIGGAVTTGTTTFEARLKDGGDGRLLGLVTEKRKSRGRGLRLKADGYVTPFPHAEAAIHKWAEDLAAMLSQS